MKQLFQQIREDVVVRFLAGSFILTGLGSLLLNRARVPDDTFALWWEHLLRDLSSELFGVLIIYLVAKSLLQQWAELNRKEQKSVEEDTLPIKKSFPVETPQQQALNSYVARLRQAATREARQVILDEMKFSGLLPGANLNNLNLQGANFYDADLRGISLEGCNLEAAYLIEANLQGANLNQANLERAELSWANLKGAFLGETNLRGAWMLQANLEDTFLRTACFDNNTRLPDGTRWTPEVPMQRFYDRRWPGFWRPDPGLFGELPRWYRREEAAR